MDIINIIKKLPSQNSNGKMDPKRIDTVVVHHDGEFRPNVYDSIARYKGEAAYHIKKGWGHISYHYIIDNCGDVFQCLPETEVGYHCGNLAINRKSIAIKFDGNMETQSLTSRQVRSYKALIKWLTTKRPDLPLVLKNSIKGHYRIRNTRCPGKNTKRELGL